MGPALVWFRDDLRLADNPALAEAARDGRPIVALYVLDETPSGPRPPGGAARWWLHRSLEQLAESLAVHDVPLVLRRGSAADIVPQVMAEAGLEAIHWNRRYDGPGRATDTALKAGLTARGLTARSHQAGLLHEPQTVTPQGGGFYKVFTPFWRACRTRAGPRAPLPAPDRLVAASEQPASDSLPDWRLPPVAPDWSGGLAVCWRPGEAGARAALMRFLDDALSNYAGDRDRPDIAGTSALSPHLRFGEISPFQVLHALDHARAAGDSPLFDQAAETFQREIGWREFCWHLLFHRPDLADTAFHHRFDAFPWRRDADATAAWQQGRTGIPIVDAGMRQLWTTGWMHNRVRMIVASFLTKHLLQDWRVGEAWFWDTLVDADAASNPANWQWVAGSGADAAPYFRIFNPITQGEKFDAQGDYVRRWVPELAHLPAATIHRPPAGQAAYPAPIVDLAIGRARALAAWEATKAGRE